MIEKNRLWGNYCFFFFFWHLEYIVLLSDLKGRKEVGEKKGKKRRSSAFLAVGSARGWG